MGTVGNWQSNRLGECSVLGNRTARWQWLGLTLPQVCHQRLVALQLRSPASCSSEQCIQIKAQLLARESLQKIDCGNGRPLLQQLIQGRQNGIAADGITIGQPHQVTDGIQQRTGCPTAQELLPEASSRQHGRPKKANHSLATLRIEQLKPGGQLRAFAVSGAHPSPEVLHCNGQDHVIDAELKTIRGLRRPR